MFKLLLYIPELVALLTAMDVPPLQTMTEANYTRYIMQDNGVIEVVEYSDSVLVVETVCAPICSSTARVYNKVSNALIRVVPPTCNGVFPFAWIENGELHWRDNTEQLLDDEEKAHLRTSKHSATNIR